MPTIQSSTSKATPSDCVSPMATTGIELRIEPKIGDERHHARQDGEDRPVLQAEEPEADRREDAVDQADQELTAHHAREAAVDARQEQVERAARVGKDQRAEESRRSARRVIIM